MPSNKVVFSRAANEAALAQGRQARERALSAEETFGTMEQLLGTEEQIAGFGEDARLLPYLATYELDEALARALGGKQPGGGGQEPRFGKGVSLDTLRSTQAQANDLMAQAAEAARGGDFETAEGLRQQAGELIGSVGSLKGVEGAVESVFSLQGDPEALARANLTGPSAETLGELVASGRALAAGPGTEEYERIRGSLVEGPQRALAVQARETEASIRDLGASRGAGRSLVQEESLLSRSREAFGRASADILADTNRFLEEWSKTWARDIVGFARDWIQGAPGVRTEFLSRLDAISQIQTQLFNQISQREEAKHQAHRARKQQEDMMYRGALLDLGFMLLGTGLGWLTGTEAPEPTITSAETQDAGEFESELGRITSGGLFESGF